MGVAVAGAEFEVEASAVAQVVGTENWAPVGWTMHIQAFPPPSEATDEPEEE